MFFRKVVSLDTFDEAIVTTHFKERNGIGAPLYQMSCLIGLVKGHVKI